MTGPIRIAIDGPSGSGKSTLGLALARNLSFPYVDTGAMYRAFAWKVLDAGAEGADQILDLMAETRMTVDADPDLFRVLVDGHDVSGYLRDPAVSSGASTVAVIPEVRAWLVALQRDLARDSVVMEGRDIGTVVLPDTDCKFFVVADENVRIERRTAQWGETSTRAASKDVKERDKRDSSRKTSPLRAADDAILIDTSEQTIDESLAIMLAALQTDGPGAPRGASSI
jgi:cytidylate kinase